MMRKNYDAIYDNYINGNLKDAAQAFFELSDDSKAVFLDSLSRNDLTPMLKTFYKIGFKEPNREYRNKIFKKAWLKWGENLQIAITIEELSEAATALARIIRGRYKPWDNEIITEIADTYIVLDSYVNKYSLSGVVNAEINKKIERLKERVGGE